MTSEYVGALTSSSLTFSRPGGSTGNYYYSALRVSISTYGIYAVGSFSNIDLYGYFYDGTFYPSNPYLNLIYQDDDSLGDMQFLLGGTLQAGRTYTLVITTHQSGVRGSFRIAVVGPAYVNFNPVIALTTTSRLTKVIGVWKKVLRYIVSLSKISHTFLKSLLVDFFRLMIFDRGSHSANRHFKC